MLNLGPAERERLIAGAAIAGVQLDARAVDRFRLFAELLTAWVSRTRLVSCRTATELVDRHLLDSLALFQLAPEQAPIVDLGSGAGFPGVPLAIARPERPVTLVEARRLRASFLREVKRALTLSHVQVLEARAEEGPQASAASVAGDVAVCRAVWSDESILPIAARWIRPAGALLWMRARGRGSERTAARPSNDGMVFEREHTYRIGERKGVIWAFRRLPDECFT